jgi:hypothetical protein
LGSSVARSWGERRRDLAALDQDTKRQIEAVRGFPDSRLVDWIEQAKTVVRGDAPDPDGEAELYRRTVAENRGRFMNADGVVERVAVGADGSATVKSFDLFDAPDGHQGSAELRDALRFIVASAGLNKGERTPLPSLESGHVAELRRARDSIAGDAPLEAASVDRLNAVLRSAGVAVRSDADPYHDVPPPGGARYEQLELAPDRYSDAPVGGQRYQPLVLSPTSGYAEAPTGGQRYVPGPIGPTGAGYGELRLASPSSTVPSPGAVYGRLQLKDPNYTAADDARLRAAMGAREDASHYRPARRYPSPELENDARAAEVGEPTFGAGEAPAESGEAAVEEAPAESGEAPVEDAAAESEEI